MAGKVIRDSEAGSINPHTSLFNFISIFYADISRGQTMSLRHMTHWKMDETHEGWLMCLLLCFLLAVTAI